MPLWLSRTLGWLCAALLAGGIVRAPAVASERVTPQCTLMGVVVPCTVQPVDPEGVQRIEIGTLKPEDWQFDEKDLPVDATALHVDLLNHVTHENALRYVTAHLYRLYRMEQARKLLALVTMRMVAYVKAKYGGDLTPQQVIEAIVLEAGLPVIAVPQAAEDIQHMDIMDLLRRSVEPPSGQEK